MRKVSAIDPRWIAAGDEVLAGEDIKSTVEMACSLFGLRLSSFVHGSRFHASFWWSSVG